MTSIAEPTLRVSLLLDFFAHGRVGTLLNANLRLLLAASLFELGATDASETPVNAFPHHEELRSRRGVLAHELQHSPHMVVAPLAKMLDDAVQAGVHMKFSAAYRSVLLFLALLAGRVLAFGVHQADSSLGQGLHETGAAHDLVQVVELHLLPLLKRWLDEAIAACEYRDAEVLSRHLAYVHATLIGYRNGEPAAVLKDAAMVLGCAQFVLVWYSESENDVTSNGMGITLRLPDVLRTYHQHRAAIVNCFNQAPDHIRAEACARACRLAMGTDGDTPNELPMHWSLLDPSVDYCSRGAYGANGGALLVDVGAGEVLVNRSAMMTHCHRNSSSNPDPNPDAPTCPQDRLYKYDANRNLNLTPNPNPNPNSHEQECDDAHS